MSPTIHETTFAKIASGSPPDEQADNLPLTIIEPQIGWLSLNLAEVWGYRDLLQLMVWRDISARYRQSILGIAWAVFRPLLTALIYTLVFSIFVKVETAVPYPIFAFSALIPWLYFSMSLTAITSSVTGGSSLLTKVYFPRLILPLAAIGPGLIEVGIQLVILSGLMAYYRFIPGPAVLLLPVFIGLTVLSAFGFGVWLTALNVRFRDVGMAVPFFLQIWMYLCPIIYPITVVPDKYRVLYSLNPMVGVIEGFRWSLLGSQSPNWLSMGISTCVLLIVLTAGLFYFRRSEATFADII